MVTGAARKELDIQDVQNWAFQMRVLPVLLGLCLVSGSAFAQIVATDARRSPLTQQDGSAVSAILDALATQQEEKLRLSVTRALDASGVDPQAVVRAVKFAAGPKLSVFQSVLTRACIGGQSGYCKLAALPDPAPNSDIRTAATGGGGGGGGGGGDGGGGSPQLNLGHTAFIPGSQPSASHAAQNPIFSLNLFQTPATTLTSTTFGSTPVSAPPTVATAPGPVAGASLPAVLAACWALWRQRRRRAPGARVS